MGIDVRRDHQTTLQVDLLVRRGQVRPDLPDDAAVDEDLAGFVVLTVDPGVGEFLHDTLRFVFGGSAQDERSVCLEKNAMPVARMKQASDM